MPEPLTYDDFRRALTGLVDRSLPSDTDEAQKLRECAVELVLVLASLYGDALDRKSMWDRISGALTVAAARVDDGDVEAYVSAALEHVRAEPTRVAASERLQDFLVGIGWVDGRRLIAHADKYRAPLLVAARLAWKQEKDDAARERGRAKAEVAE